MTSKRENTVKLQLISKTISEIQRDNKRVKEATLLYQIIGYSLTPEDVSYSVRFMKTLIEINRDVAKLAYIESHSLRMVRAACKHVRTMLHGLD